MIPSLIPNPAPFPTGRVISGGDEEDPDHAGNPGERIWEGTTPHTAHSQTFNIQCGRNQKSKEL